MKKILATAGIAAALVLTATATPAVAAQYDTNPLVTFCNATPGGFEARTYEASKVAKVISAEDIVPPFTFRDRNSSGVVLDQNLAKVYTINGVDIFGGDLLAANCAL